MNNENKNIDETNNESSVMSDKKFFMLLIWPLLAPFIVIAITFVGMFIGIGWLFVSMVFFTSLSSMAIGILGILGTIANLENGVGAILISLSVSLLGFGLVYPLFTIAKDFAKGFLITSRGVIRKVKELYSRKVKEK